MNDETMDKLYVKNGFDLSQYNLEVQNVQP